MLSPEDDEEERFVFGLRMAEGVAPRDWAEGEAERRERTLAALVAAGAARQSTPGRWTLTARGREVADSAIEALMK